MLHPSHLDNTFKAQHIFTNREKHQNDFINALNTPQNNENYRLLNYYGVGGMGKTALCEQFCLILEEKKQEYSNLSWAKIDFELLEYRNAANTLLALRLQLAERCDIHFPAFDTAFARYFSFTQQGQNIHDCHPALFNQASDILQDIESVIGDVLDEIPGAGLFYKYFKKFKIHTQNWWQRRGKTILNDLDKLDQHKLLQALPVYLGADLYDWMFDESKAAKLQQRRIVILLDTYEALWRDQPTKTGHDAIRVDLWLRQLAIETPGILYVILGRDKLNWGSEWQNEIDAHLLGGLSSQDANRFLRKVPIEENHIRQCIIKNSSGIPFYLDLQVDLYEHLKQQQISLESCVFGAIEKEILPRFTDHLDEITRQSLRIVSYARFIDESLTQKLSKEVLGGIGNIDFKNLTNYSFWKYRNSFWSMHSLMREYLQIQEKRDRPELFRQIHQFIFEYYDKQLENLTQVIDLRQSHQQALQEASYHLRLLDIKKFPDWICKQGQIFYEAYSWESLSPLLKKAKKITEEHLGDDHIDTAYVLHSLADMYKSQGEYSIAEPLYEKSLRLGKRILGEDHPDVAIMLDSLANIYMSKHEEIRAELLYEQSLQIKEETLGKNHLSVATTLDSLAILYKYQRKYTEAESLHKRSLKIRSKNLNNEHPDIAITLNNLALLYKSQARYEEAESLYKRSLQIREDKLGKDHPDVGATLNNLAMLYKSQKRYTDAESLYKRSLDIRKTKLKESHPEVVATLSNLANLYKAQKKYDKAELLYLQSLNILKNKWGENHPDVAMNLNNLAGVLYYQKKYSEAQKKYQYAINIMKKLFPYGHPTLDTFEANYAYLYEVTIKYS